MANWREFKNRRWVVGVSGGADSMALLAMCLEKQLDVIVAHVNYQKRATANRDMMCVVNFCKAHDVMCHVAYCDPHHQGNFQAYARAYRYDFYRLLADTYSCGGVLVAHQMDDVIETYLMQRKRHATPQYYGIREELILHNILVVRPLLSYTKKDLLKYCEKHAIPYYDDESNFSDDYERNRIRHAVVDTLRLEDKKQMIREIEELNEAKQKQERLLFDAFSKWQMQRSLKDLRAMSETMRLGVLRMFLKTKIDVAKLSGKELQNISDMIMQSTHNWVYELDDTYSLVHNYEILSIEETNCKGYAYTYDAICYEETPYFAIREEGETIERLALAKEDFPITIRNARAGDFIRLRFGTKKVARWFIDRKIPYRQRQLWPVVENAAGNVIFVVGIGCDIAHFTNNSYIFVIK